MNGSSVLRVVLLVLAAICALAVLFGVPADVDAVEALAVAVLFLVAAALV